jgi:hypothetical protein
MIAAERLSRRFAEKMLLIALRWASMGPIAVPGLLRPKDLTVFHYELHILQGLHFP